MKYWRDFLLSTDATILDVIAVLGKNQCSVIIDSKEHVIGTFNNRDIRKALLR